MIYVHKILPAFLMPTTIAIVLIASGLLSRRRALCWIGLVLVWMASTPFIGQQMMRIAEGWQTRAPFTAVPAGDAIVVLSYGLVQPPGDSSTTEWLDPDRFFGGVELFKNGKAPVLIFTGGWIPWRQTARSEGDVLSEYAVRFGVPRERILVTPKVSNTEEEGIAVRDLLAKRLGQSGRPRVLLVTSAFHMRRAKLLFERAGLHVSPFPVDFKVPEQTLTIMDFLPGGGGLAASETALRELYGLAYYKLVKG